MPLDQQPLERQPQLVRRHNERQGGLRMLRFKSTKIVNESGFERGMKRAGHEAEHEDRQS